MAELSLEETHTIGLVTMMGMTPTTSALSGGQNLSDVSSTLDGITCYCSIDAGKPRCGTGTIVMLDGRLAPCLTPLGFRRKCGVELKMIWNSGGLRHCV